MKLQFGHAYKPVIRQQRGSGGRLFNQHLFQKIMNFEGIDDSKVIEIGPIALNLETPVVHYDEDEQEILLPRYDMILQCSNACPVVDVL